MQSVTKKYIYNSETFYSKTVVTSAEQKAGRIDEVAGRTYR